MLTSCPGAKVNALVRAINSVFKEVVPTGTRLDSMTSLRETIT